MKHSSTKATLSSITVMKAVTAGWAEQHKITARELSILTYVVVWGWRGDERYEFSWCPIVGVEGWAHQMGIPYRAFRRAWVGLVEKGVLVEVPGNNRYPATRGLSMLPEVAQECAFWADQRNPFDKKQDPTSTTSTCHERQVEVTIVSGSHDTIVRSTPPLTCGFSTHTPEVPQSDPATYVGDADASHQDRKESMPLNYEDDWDQPNDDDSSWAEPSDRPEKPKRRAAPTSRLAQHFWDEWVECREEYPNLALPWSVKQAFLANLKRLLVTFTEEQLAEQMTQFFRLIRSGKVATRSDELWKDFLTYRGQAVRGVQRKTESVDTDDYIAAALARQEQA